MILLRGRKKSVLILFLFMSQVKDNTACQKNLTYIHLAAEHL